MCHLSKVLCQVCLDGRAYQWGVGQGVHAIKALCTQIEADSVAIAERPPFPAQQTQSPPELISSLTGRGRFSSGWDGDLEWEAGGVGHVCIMMYDQRK